MVVNKEVKSMFFLTIKPVYQLKANDVLICKDKDMENEYDLLRVEEINKFEARELVSVKFKYGVVRLFNLYKNVVIVDDFDFTINNIIKSNGK